MPNIITVYFSRKGQNDWNGSMKDLKKGNTEIVAEFIQNAVSLFLSVYVWIASAIASQ